MQVPERVKQALRATGSEPPSHVTVHEGDSAASQSDSVNAEAFTRDGRFNLDDQGQIITRTGELVMGDGGPITVDPEGGPLSVSREGSINQDGIVLGTLRVAMFQTPGGLERLGSNLWRATDETPQPATEARIRGGFVEGSNVNAVLELTEMIEISRAYTSISKMIAQSDELRGASIEKLARVG